MTRKTAGLGIPSRYTETGKTLKGGFGEIVILHDGFLARDVVLKKLQDPSDDSQLRAELTGAEQRPLRHTELRDWLRGS